MTLPKPYYQDDLVTIYHGDNKDILWELPPGQVDVIMTDPPYGIRYNENDLAANLEFATGKMKKTRTEMRESGEILPEMRPIANDGLEEYKEMMQSWLLHVPQLLKPEKSCVLAFCAGGGSNLVWVHCANLMAKKPLEFIGALVWYKDRPGLGWRYRSSYEFIMVAVPEGRKMPWYDETDAVHNVLVCKNVIPNNEQHPTVKPVHLMERLIILHTKPGDLILDPFMGEGTTLRAAKNLGRRAIGIELEEKWCKRAASSMQQNALFI